ncbi:MAG: alpha/beta hydrolase [Betaproteobacteria bacterium]
MPRRPLARILFIRIVVGLLVVAGLSTGCASLEQREREMTFRAAKSDAGWYGGVPDGVQEMYLPVSTAAEAPRIHAWWWAAADANAPAVLFLHGAHWNLTGHVRRMEQLHRMGYAVFAIDYRGFGKSDGDLPSEAMAYEDARAAWLWMAKRQPDPARRLIFGHSLGGAIAIDLAASMSGHGPQARGLIVESSFTTLADAANALTFDWLPARQILTQKFDSLEKIKSVDMPVLVVHGIRDRLLPSRFSESLYQAANGPKKLLLIENASHNNSMWVGDVEYQLAIGDLFGLPGAAQATAPSRPR